MEKQAQVAAAASPCWVFVRAAGTLKKDSFELDKSDTIAKVKQVVMDQLGVEVWRQRLILDMDDTTDKAIEPDESMALKDVFKIAGETEGTRLELVLDMTGGGTSGVFYGSIFKVVVFHPFPRNRSDLLKLDRCGSFIHGGFSHFPGIDPTC